MRNINIKAVTQMTGVNENTLRAWERRYALVKPLRGEDGRRLYSEKDIEKLNAIHQLLKAGYRIGSIAELSLEKLKKMDLGGARWRQENQAQPFLGADTSASENFLEAITEALKKFDLDSVQNILQKAKFELSPKTILFGLILPLFHRVGNLVSEAELSVAQEHLLSSLLRDYLGAIYQGLSSSERQARLKKEKVIITTREGDLHEFSVLMAAIIFRLHGHQTFYLGPHMPAEDLAQASQQFGIHTIVLGLAELPARKEFISADQYLKKLDRLVPKKVNLFCGGTSVVEKNLISSGRKFINFKSIEDLDLYLSRSTH